MLARKNSVSNAPFCGRPVMAGACVDFLELVTPEDISRDFSMPGTTNFRGVRAPA